MKTYYVKMKSKGKYTLSDSNAKNVLFTFKKNRLDKAGSRTPSLRVKKKRLSSMPTYDVLKGGRKCATIRGKMRRDEWELKITALRVEYVIVGNVAEGNYSVRRDEGDGVIAVTRCMDERNAYYVDILNPQLELLGLVVSVIADMIADELNRRLQRDLESASAEEKERQQKRQRKKEKQRAKRTKKRK